MRFFSTLFVLLLCSQLVAQNFDHELTNLNLLLKENSSYKEHFFVDAKEHALVMTTGKYSATHIATVTIPLEKVKFIEVKVLDKDICSVYLYTERPLNQIAIRSTSYQSDTDFIAIFIKNEEAADKMAIELAKITAYYSNATLKLSKKEAINVNDLTN
ncbi:MAG: hypothetical protein RL329_1106 [Bacteroidota bacterium]|jgi:hypothetical protein